MKDYYKILKVNKNASTLEIKKAFRILAKLLHPDVNKSENAHIEFLEINEAYKVLNNPIKRIQYDKLYNYQILKITPKNQKRYNKRHSKWERHVNKSANKGEKKGRKYSKENDKKFQKRVSKWDKFWNSEIVTFIFDVIFGLIRVILEVIFTI